MLRVRTKARNKKAPRTERVLSYTVLLRPETEGGYTVLVPSLPGCITYGKTVSNARAMAEEAIGLYVESLRDMREPVPTEKGSLLSSVTVRV